MANEEIKISQLDTAPEVEGSDETTVVRGDHTYKASYDQILNDLGVTGHIQDASIHALLDDSATAEDKLWSSKKIVEHVNSVFGVEGADALPVSAGGTGLNVVDSGKMLYASAPNTFQAVGLASTLRVVDGILEINLDELRAHLGGVNIGFQPAALSKPLMLWLDAAQGVTQDSTLVSRWRNLAPTGEAYDAVQSDPGKQPVYSESSGPNGYPGIDFGGAFDHYLELLGGGLNIAKNVDALTVCVVMNPVYPEAPAEEPGTIIHISTGTNAEDPRFSYHLYNDEPGQRIVQAQRTDDGTYGIVVSTNAPPEAACWDTVVMEYGNEVVTMYHDGLEWNPEAIISDDGNTSNTSSLKVTIGALPTGGWVLNGAVSEILIWQGKLSAAERASLDRYINTKYFNFNAQNVDYFFYVGDSLIYGLGITEDEDRLHNQVAGLLAPISGVSFYHVNWGLGGLKASESLAYWENTHKLSNIFLPNARKKYLIIGLGANDIFAGDSTTTILNNIRMLVDFYKKAGFIVLPWTTPPMDEDYNAQASALAQAMRDNWEDFGWDGLIEANDAVDDPPSSDYQVDNTHLSEAGVAKVAQAVVDTIENLAGYPYT